MPGHPRSHDGRRHAEPATGPAGASGGPGGEPAWPREVLEAVIPTEVLVAAWAAFCQTEDLDPAAAVPFAGYRAMIAVMRQFVATRTRDLVFGAYQELIWHAGDCDLKAINAEAMRAMTPDSPMQWQGQVWAYHGAGQLALLRAAALESVARTLEPLDTASGQSEPEKNPPRGDTQP